MQNTHPSSTLESINVLDRIIAEKQLLVAKAKQDYPLNTLLKDLEKAPLPRGFEAALRQKSSQGNHALIAEIKKASPSKGLIRADFNPREIAIAYEKGGAACLSVLTDINYFQGNDAYLIEAKAAVRLPILRKDFMVDPYQIFHSRLIGADCILLIMAALNDALAAELEDIALSLGMSVLIEVHDENELERALLLKSNLIGVNNRNLKTLEVDINTSKRLLQSLPSQRFGIAESGLSTPQDLSDLSSFGAKGFLIGESLMRQDDIEAATRHILSIPR